MRHKGITSIMMAIIGLLIFGMVIVVLAASGKVVVSNVLDISNVLPKMFGGKIWEGIKCAGNLC